MWKAELTIDNTGLQFDRDYGVSKRTGWSVLKGGSVRVQFVSLWRALWVLAGCLIERGTAAEAEA